MPALVLVPTALERARLEALGGLGGLTADGAPPDVELAGFGPVAAAARAASLLAGGRHERVLLLGIAGAFDADTPLGTATAFGRVRLDGVGAGAGPDFVPPGALGFPQWSDARGDVHDELELAGEGPALVTVCAAARGAAQVAARRARHPDALGEDMEAFGVALAARLAGVPLEVVRGWSNRAGDGDVRGWRIDEALAAARELALVRLSAEVPR